jgi:hypothetical protein
LTRPIPRERRQLAGFAALTAAAAAFAEALQRTSGARGFFEPYFGAMPAGLVFGAVMLAGLASLRVLQLRGWLKVASQRWLAGIGIAAGTGLALAAPAILVDRFVHLDVNNTPWPWSLLFYPAIALVVEVCFHLAPLALFAAALNLAAPVRVEGNALIPILATSLLEPAYQLASSLTDQPVAWLSAFVWAQVWAVNLAQLFVFRRFGFAAMYALRIAYYLCWHIVWGYARQPQ